MKWFKRSKPVRFPSSRVQAAFGAILLAAGLPGCGPEGADAQKAVTQAVQQAAPAARRGAWHGTVTVRTTASGTFPDESNNEFAVTEHSVSVVHTANLDVNGDARATLSYEKTSQSQFRYDYDAYTITGNAQELVSASGPSPEARVSIELYPDGRYTIDYSARAIDGTGHATGQSFERCKPGTEPGMPLKDPECRDKHNTTDDTYPVADLGSVSGGVEGRTDRNDRDVLAGTESYPYELKSGVTGRTVVTWALRR